MSRWLPFPLLALGLLLVWVLLTGSASPGSLLLGAALALGAARFGAALGLTPLRPRRPLAALALAGIVLVEIVRSNLAVARIVLSRGDAQRHSGFVRIPLTTRDPYALTMLACIVTATPGTLWVEYDSADNAMLLHVLDLKDEGEWMRIVRDRYERRLMEILG